MPLPEKCAFCGYGDQEGEGMRLWRLHLAFMFSAIALAACARWGYAAIFPSVTFIVLALSFAQDDGKKRGR